MKKIISLILAVIMIFSVTALAVSAASPDDGPIEVTFIFDKDDGKGNGVPDTKVIYVDYDEDFTKWAPKATYVNGGWKYYIKGWSTDDYGPVGKVYTNLPTIPECDGITKITFTAQPGAEELTPESVIGGATENVVNGLFGEDTMTFINYIIGQIKAWFGQLLLLLGTMM